MADNRNTIDPITTLRGKLPIIEIHHVTEEELKILEHGTSGSLNLNFALVFLTTAVSTTITLLTLENISPIALAVMFGILFSGYMGGFLLLALWYKAKDQQKDVLNKIRARINFAKEQQIEAEKNRQVDKELVLKEINNNRD